MSDGTAVKAGLATLCAGEGLSADACGAAVAEMMDGAVSVALMAGFLAALRVKGEGVDEIVGAARSMRARSERVSSHREPLVDTCGTGGDGASTFSVSTAAALVAAAAGAPVAKHGNRAASGKFGGADTLEALGVVVDLDAAAAGRCLDEVGMAFLFAPRMHTAMRHVGPVRRELGVRTIFNLLGPLTNPAGVRRQVVGVASPPTLALIANALARLGCDHALVVHGHGGMDEISLSGPTQVIEVRQTSLRSFTLEPAAFGLPGYPQEAFRADSLEQSVRMVRAVLDGEAGPGLDLVLANAAAALLVAGLASDLPDGVARARRAILSGGARDLLGRLGLVSRRESTVAAGCARGSA